MIKSRWVKILAAMLLIFILLFASLVVFMQMTTPKDDSSLLSCPPSGVVPLEPADAVLNRFTFVYAKLMGKKPRYRNCGQEVVY